MLGKWWEEGKGGSLSSLFPLPIGPQRSLFLSLQSPYNAKRPLRRREVGAWFLWLFFFAGAEELLVSLRGYVTPGRSFPAVCAPDEDIALKVKFVLKSLQSVFLFYPYKKCSCGVVITEEFHFMAWSTNTQFQCLYIVLNNKPGPLFLEFNLCEGKL